MLYESVEPRDAEKHWLNKWAEKTKLAQTQAFMLPRVKDMSGWILNETKNQNGQIEKAAADRLVEMVGADTRQAAQEISKLLAYVNWARNKVCIDFYVCLDSILLLIGLSFDPV